MPQLPPTMIFVLKLKGIFQPQPLLIFLAQIQRRAVRQRAAIRSCAAAIFAPHMPVDANCRVIPCQAALIVRVPEVANLIAEFRFVAQHKETMRKAFRNQELLLIFR